MISWAQSANTGKIVCNIPKMEALNIALWRFNPTAHVFFFVSLTGATRIWNSLLLRRWSHDPDAIRNIVYGPRRRAYCCSSMWPCVCLRTVNDISFSSCFDTRYIWKIRVFYLAAAGGKLMWLHFVLCVLLSSAHCLYVCTLLDPQLMYIYHKMGRKITSRFKWFKVAHELLLKDVFAVHGLYARTRDVACTFWRSFLLLRGQ